MQQIYCELHEDSAKILKMPRYVTYITEDFGNFGGNLSVVYSSERVWVQDGSSVVFAKNRHGDPITTKVDMKEFMWVKLKSVEIRVGI
jgi:hypothetical protein